MLNGLQQQVFQGRPHFNSFEDILATVELVKSVSVSAIN